MFPYLPLMHTQDEITKCGNKSILLTHNVLTDAIISYKHRNQQPTIIGKDDFMKIKWKITGVSIFTILILTVTIISVTYIQIKNLVNTEFESEIKNYSNMGLQLIDTAYPGDWSVQDGVLYKGDTVINDNHEIQEYQLM